MITGDYKLSAAAIAFISGSNPAKFVMMPGNAKGRHVYVEQRLKQMAQDACTMPVNRVEMRDTKIGVITSGIPYQYVREALPDASVLKLGLVHPLPRKLIEEFASKVDTLYVVEELEPVIEEQVKSWGIKAIGKEILTVQGEYSANMLRKAILHQELDIEEPAAVPARPPILCPGCPHRSVFSVMNKLGIHAAGDIGCYTLGAVAPLNVIDTTVCMGASISTLHGMEKAKGRDYIRNWVAMIGDSTFMHTGINLMGQEVPAISIYHMCKAMGIEHVVEVDAFDIQTLEKVVKEEVNRDGVSVIITKSPCVLLKTTKTTHKLVVHSDKCKKCGLCLKPGCPALTKAEDGTVKVDATMCNGCGLCAKRCPFGALEQVAL